MGATPGIYTSWQDCQSQIVGFPGAKYKSFNNLAEAEYAFGKNYQDFISTTSKPKISKNSSEGIIRNSISVDAACSGNPGKLEYQGVVTLSKDPIFHQGPFEDGTNNIGEFLAIVHALALLKKNNKHDIVIYSDSTIAIGWVKNKKAKTKLQQNNKNAILFELIKRAEEWLKNNTYENPILKWETTLWGENPADFGRK